ncbi:hypothetical protein UM719_00220 [Staphylococcus aureus]|nr:hypothetical protein UM719_00220 [Staphylococcus aureus]WRN72248.1 hypothetical protein UM760_13780 [Staphylococcus aureus]
MKDEEPELQAKVAVIVKIDGKQSPLFLLVYV